MANVSFTIIEHLGGIKVHGNGWSRELNIVSWNGGEPKYDIREWDPRHEKMYRGITMTAKEMAAVAELHRQHRDEKNSDATFSKK